MKPDRPPLEALFSTFSKNDWREFRAFARSPLHQTRADVARLADLFAEAAPNFPTKKAIEKAVDPAAPEPFDPKKIGYALGYLQKTAFDFLTWQELSADSERGQIALLRALRKRGAARFFEKEWAAARDRTERQPLRHVAHFRRQSQLFLEF